ncbi:MAG: hypothetical protein IPJ77_14320 [Planctomycetes bacterium]|nr:hypothetical protein [Planctomycetota bacterium]
MSPRLASLALAVCLVVSTLARGQDFGPWHAIGPYPHPAGASSLEPAQAPERFLKSMAAGKEGPDVATPIKTKDGSLRWTPVTPGDGSDRALDAGLLDFNVLVAPSGAANGWNAKQVAYLYRRIDCVSATELPIALGSDDGVRMWLNGEVVVERAVPRGLNLEDHQLVLHLLPGANHLLVKVTNEGGAWSFRMAPWKRIEQAAIDRAIDRGVEHLLGAQLLDGTWGDHPEFGAGHTAFTVYTLLKSGVPAEEPAVVHAMGAMEALPAEHTYSLACMVLALAATHDERHRARVEECVRDLIEFQNGQDLFSYPILPNYPSTLPPDLSNTLYAALAFRAAERMGVDVPDKVWIDLAQGTLRCLGKEQAARSVATGKTTSHAAGFSYRAGTFEVTGSMTTAGLSVLALAQEGTGPRFPPAMQQRTKNAIQLGLGWLDQNMKWDQNPGQNGHHYFWIYGVERAGTLLGVDLIAGIDWYWSGAAYLVKKQRDNGSWSSGGGEGDEPIDTLLALLFLERATAPIASGVGTDHARLDPRKPRTADEGERKTEWSAGSERDPLSIHARGEAQTVLWVSGLREDLKQAITGPKGIEVKTLEFLGRASDEPEDAERVLGSATGRFVLPDDLARLEYVHVFERPGTWTVRARLSVLVAGTQLRVIDTPPVAVVVRTVFDRRRLQYVLDPERNLLRGLDAKCEASSNAPRAKEAFDGRYSSAWECGASDATPWLRITLPRGMPAERLTLAHALTRVRDAAKPRAREVEVVVNGDVKLRVVMDADNRLKSSVELPPRTPIRSLELRILSLHDGKLGTTPVGFSEIELSGGR